MSKLCSTTSSLESPFCEHFNTNYVPTEAEIERIRAHLVPHEAELARLEALIQELAAQRDRVKQYIEPHRALISHPCRLPQDIIEEIFLGCLPVRHNAIMSVVDAPLLLGHICSVWRSIALSMPRLWNSLHISAAWVASSESKHAAIVDWLERSAPLPLALSVTGDDLNILHSLLQFSPRWRVLHLSEILVETLYKLAEVDVPLLTEIKIKVADGFEDTQSDFLSSNLFRTMQNGQIFISGTGLGLLIPKQFTWDNVTHIDLDSQLRFAWAHSEENVHVGTVYRLLKGCPQLVALRSSLSQPPDDEGDAWPEEVLAAKSLQSLILHRVDPRVAPHNVMNLVDHLLMPQL
ncbi:hypothetical protein C8R45DRAFT_1148164 [Mycena sanguinolenta]|nr:hypothetical protein C8R45DRAFT_1148164 [Mycena sanguinolenta]